MTVTSIAEEDKTRVLLADDHVVIREGVASLFAAQRDMVVIGEASDGEETLSSYFRLRPDVLILELRMPKLDGITVLEKILSIDSRARALVFTASDAEQDISRALKAGAKGYLLKSTPREEFFHAIRAVSVGRTIIPPAVATKITSCLMSESLTRRELDVLRCLADGKPNKQISYKLEVSEGTVKTHVNSIFRKLRCGNRAEAVAVAVRRGFIRL